MGLMGQTCSFGDSKVPQPQYESDGGVLTFSNYSGAVGPDLLVVSGPGRLNRILAHTQMQSGQSVVFYDSGVAASGGPFAASGHNIIGVLPPTYGGGFISGQIQATTVGSLKIDMPFRSGLCMSTRSGQPGCTVSYSPEINKY